MIYPIDRVQSVDEELYAFEFINLDEINAVDIQKNKAQVLLNTQHFKKIIQVEYSGSKIKEVPFVVNIEVQCKYNKALYKNYYYKMNYKSFRNFFTKMNQESNFEGNSYSKRLGSVKGIGSLDGDAYIQGILAEIYKDSEGIVEFVSKDDNGIKLTKELLGNEPTYGFDFDIFSPENSVVVEFLKREKKIVNNKNAHPNRYFKGNLRKFKSLWDAANKIDGELFLVNYSDDGDNNISVIRVYEINFDEPNPRIIHDCGYLLNGEKELIEWLELLENKSHEYLSFLEKKPKQERNLAFWNDSEWRRELGKYQ